MGNKIDNSFIVAYCSIPRTPPLLYRIKLYLMLTDTWSVSLRTYIADNCF